MKHVDINDDLNQKHDGRVDDLYAKAHVARPGPGNRIDGPLVTKMIVGAVSFMACALLVSVRVMVRTYGDDAAVNPVVAITIAIGSAAVGAGLGAMLGLKDRVQQRMASGDHVGLVMRSLFGNGARSLGIWVFLILFSVLFVLPILLTLRTL